MLDGFHRAVQVQPAEVTNGERYRCGALVANADGADEAAKPCLFAVFDAGAGRTLLSCVTHATRTLAADWSGAMFPAGTLPLLEALARLRAAFARHETPGMDVEAMTPAQPNFGALLQAIVFNVEAMERSFAEAQR